MEDEKTKQADVNNAHLNQLCKCFLRQRIAPVSQAKYTITIVYNENSTGYIINATLKTRFEEYEQISILNAAKTKHDTIYSTIINTLKIK